MGIKISRKKPRHILASLLYRLLKLPIPNRTKFRLFLDLEWIFNRLSNEQSHYVYGPENHPWRNNAFEFIAQNIEPGSVVLDLGCGYGEISAMLADQGATVVGVDHDSSKIETAKSTYEKNNLSFLCLDAIDYLQTKEVNFDVLILSHVLEHIDEPADFLERFKGYFKFIYIEVPDFDATILNYYRVDLDLALNHTDNDHVTEFDRNELNDMFLKCDLSVMSSQYIFAIQRYWCKVGTPKLDEIEKLAQTL